MSSLARRRWLTGGVVVFILAMGMAPGFGQVVVVPEAHQDFISALSLSDVGALSAGPSSPTGRGRPPRVGPNVRANDLQQGLPNGLFGRSETAVAASDDGRYIVAGWNDAQGFCGPPFGAPCPPLLLPGLSGYAFSSDAGLTWIDGGAPPVVDHVLTRGDPWLARGGSDGATYLYANLAVDDRDANVSLGVSVHRGRFGLGGAFVWEDIRAFNAPNPGDFYDKEAIAAMPGTPDAYVSLTNFIELPCPAFPNTAGAFGQIEVWRTHDGGDTWQGPTVASPDMTTNVDTADPNCGNTGVLQQSSAPAIGPSGEVYVVWQQGPTFTGASGSVVSTDAKIVAARSYDGGVTFGTPVQVADINSMRQNPPVGYNRDRINDHPRVAVATSGPHKGRVYVAYYTAAAPVTAGSIAPCPAPVIGNCREQTLTSSQAYVKYSDDQGLTWSAASPVAPAPPATGLKRWWPVVSVEPGGNVDVVYHESREEPVASGAVCQVTVAGSGASTLRRRGSAHSLVDTYWVQSTNGGTSFRPPLKVSTATSNWCTAVSNIRPNFGDYIGSTSGGNRTLALWADSRNGVPDAFFAAILGAGRSRP